MPDLSNYDNEKDWMEACVPTRIDEGDEQDQAVAACLNMWRERDKAAHKGEAAGHVQQRREQGRLPDRDDEGLMVSNRRNDDNQ